MEGVVEAFGSVDYEPVVGALYTCSAFLLRKPPIELLRIVPLESFFSVFPRIRPTELHVLVSILQKILSPTVTPSFTTMLVEDLALEKSFLGWYEHPSDDVRCLVVDQVVKRFGEAEKANADLLFRLDKRQTLLDLWIRALADPSLSVVKIAHVGFVSMLKLHGPGIMEQLLQGDVVSRFRQVLYVDVRGRAVLTLRLFELFVEISQLSDACFVACVRTGLLDELVDLIEIPQVLENVLTLLNVLELFKGLMGSQVDGSPPPPPPRGRHLRSRSEGAMEVGDGEDVAGEAEDVRCQFFQRKGLFGRVIALYSRFGDDPMMSVFLVSLIGALKDRQSSFDVSPALFQRLSRNLVEMSDRKVVQVSLEVIGTIVSRSSERLSDFVGNRQLMETYARHLKSREADLSSACLYSIATVLQGDLPVEQISHFFSFFAGFIMHELFEILKSPFDELRVAVLNLFRSMAVHKFGTKILIAYPAFYPFIIDRSTETSDLCLEVKFQVIKELAAVMKASYSEFDQKMTIEFMAYVRNGAFFVDEANVKVKWNAN